MEASAILAHLAPRIIIIGSSHIVDITLFVVEMVWFRDIPHMYTHMTYLLSIETRNHLALDQYQSYTIVLSYKQNHLVMMFVSLSLFITYWTCLCMKFTCSNFRNCCMRNQLQIVNTYVSNNKIYNHFSFLIHLEMMHLEKRRKPDVDVN